MRLRTLLAVLLVVLGCTHLNAAIRIKDITAVQGVRTNQLVGYGLVVGLNGTGDSLRNSPFTEQSLQSMERIAAIVASTKAQLWIHHDKPQADKQKKSPAFYD